MKFVVFGVTMWICRCSYSDICRKLWRDLCLSFGIVFFDVTSLFLFSGPEFSSATRRLSNRFVKLIGVGISGLSRRSGFIDFEYFHCVLPFSFDKSIWIINQKRKPLATKWLYLPSINKSFHGSESLSYLGLEIWSSIPT